MQALYAFQLAREADKEVVKLKLAECYLPDLNSTEVQDKDALKEAQKRATRLFEENFENGHVESAEDIPEEMIKTVNEHIEMYNEFISKDKSHTQKNMLNELDRLYNLYLKLLLIPQEFAQLDKRNADKQVSKTSEPGKSKFNFHKNPYVMAFKEFKALELEVIRKNITWDNHREQLTSWFKELRKDDETFKEYQAKSAPTDEDHLEMLNLVLKSVPFKMDNASLFLEEENLHWAENKAIIKSLINKTLKSFEKDSEEKFELMELNKNEEEDLPFFKELFKATIGEDEKFEDIIAKKAKNWEVGRMASLDRIILKMALAEMINFPSIPVKVSINEYIELSKKYSTPKSKQFVNGILDVLANELTSEGVIRKSGRGLIDNQ